MVSAGGFDPPSPGSNPGARTINYENIWTLQKKRW